MKRRLWAIAAFAIFGVAGVGGFAALRPNLWPLGIPATVVIPAAQTDRAVIYYQDPDGRPFYSLTPKRTADGRDFRPMFAGQDLRA
jgi:membrane fusion protein, copper/silver efflux system